MDPASLILVSVAVVILISAITAVVVIRRFGPFPGKPVASVEADLERSWELQYTAERNRTYRLCVKLHYQTTSGLALGSAAYFGLESDHRVTVDGQPLTEEAVGFHKRSSDRLDRVITMAYFTRETRAGDFKSRKGTYVLCQLPPIRAGQRIVASGTFRPLPETDVVQLEVFLGR